MQRGLVHALAWVLATGAAMALSWYGVRSVLTGTAYDPPRALPIARGAQSTTENWASSTHRPNSPLPPSASPSPSPTPPKTSSRKPSGGATTPPKTKPPRQREPEADGNVRSYPVKGGRVVFDMGDVSAELVSATPDAGWQMQVWKQAQWIRVDFVSGADTTSVFCTWHDGPPRVRIDEP